MKFNLSLTLLFSALVKITSAVAHVVRAAKCDVDQAYSILENLSTGPAFCTSYIGVTGIKTKTKTTTITVKSDCTATKTQTVHATFTLTKDGKTTTLPVITVTEYTSTILVPSGPTPVIKKRSPATLTAANKPATSISDCPSETISAACSSLIGKTITKTTLTSTKDKKCTDTTISTTTTFDKTVTTKIPVSVFPPPLTISASGVLTTTVPAACAGPAYFANGNGVGNNIIPLEYPDFPRTGVECCVTCFKRQNCVAAAVIGSDGDFVECDLLIHVDGVQDGVSGMCPLGTQDYPFGDPVVGGNVWPGPCGR